MYADVHPHEFHRHTHNAALETQSTHRTDGKLNKEPYCYKSFIFAQGKTLKTMFCSCQTMFVLSCMFSLCLLLIKVGPVHLHVSRTHNSGRKRPVENNTKTKGGLIASFSFTCDCCRIFFLCSLRCNSFYRCP